MDHHGFLFLPDRAVIYMCLNQIILKTHYWLSWLMLVWNAGSAAWQQTLYFSCCNITITNSAITWELLGLSLIISFSAFQLENKVEVWLSLHKAYLSRLCREMNEGLWIHKLCESPLQPLFSPHLWARKWAPGSPHCFHRVPAPSHAKYFLSFCFKQQNPWSE